jgi:hypothetical protein|tara:strand:- start:481 stop:723 length:243 start_codon:yes stop_codon:yes gene_type:complete
MRLDFTTIKEVFESQDSLKCEIGSSFEKNAISFRFGYWQKADVKKIESIVPSYLTVKEQEIYDDDCGWKYYYDVIDNRFQ